ncbi:tartrate-resistant acid phosphatase type 5-like [Saccostrea echinata]|uniref:tartrate-resistant acid phosphatase type 5-like n=1 Tax=Saccostrea echinata TaxID=191078 RepID=UPI002A82FCA9|nr:tartrate-resistant acid phosphatase type 5-like [Saccostrea echinata]XP_061192479.1 tartrate-resistant acid phosphatase type 5-like [Saccostrea echinata]
MAASNLKWFVFLFAFSFIGSCLAVDSVRLMILGDWGGLPTPPYHTAIEMGVAKQMSVVAKKYGPEAILALGDNFYYDGIKDSNDKRFEETFEKVFAAQPGLDSIPWNLVAGNHDHNGNVSGQIEYSKRSKVWRFPNYYYPLTYNIPGGGVVQILMIDTVLLCGNTGDDFLHDQPHGPVDLGAADDQLAWITQNLKSSSADYLFVAGHFPVYSIAEHGPTQCLIDKLLPLLQQYQAVYLSGHDHNLQHLQVSRPGLTMNFFVIGAANFADNSNAHAKDVPAGSSKFFWAKMLDLGGFAYMEITKQNATFTFIDGVGKNLYQKLLLPRRIPIN